jgi:hypothetical protein
MLVAAGLAIVIEAALAAVWGAAMAKRTLKLNDRLATDRALLESDLEKLRLAMEEMRRLWRPYRRILRWLGHPLTIALWQSYIRRRLVR